MGHSHHHHHHSENLGDGRIATAVSVNLALTLAQIIGGVLSGSLALIADALHNLSDAISLIIAFVARRIARRPADEKMTFGYGRIEIVAALINYTTLIVVGLWLAAQAVERFFVPQAVAGWPIIWLAALALVIDLITALLTFTMAKDSMNIRAAFLHNLADALGSIAVIVAGIVILTKGWMWIDPAITLIIAGYILWMAFNEIGDSIRILMMGSPKSVTPAQVTETIVSIDGVESVHDLRIWDIQEHEIGLIAHVVVASSHVGNTDWIKDKIRLRIHDLHDVEMAMLEIETAPEVCP